jgi:chromosome condensin MukBEF MukE localization factor
MPHMTAQPHHVVHLFGSRLRIGQDLRDRTERLIGYGGATESRSGSPHDHVSDHAEHEHHEKP